jgi:hypothetical protein
LNLKLCSKQCNKIDLLHLIVVPQLRGGWQHNYSNKTRQAGPANEKSMYYLMFMGMGNETKISKKAKYINSSISVAKTISSISMPGYHWLIEKKLSPLSVLLNFLLP